jgi:hypothetical protein
MIKIIVLTFALNKNLSICGIVEHFSLLRCRIPIVIHNDLSLEPFPPLEMWLDLVNRMEIYSHDYAL